MKHGVWSVPFLMLGSALACAGSAWAQASPYTLSASQSFTYQPNVFQAGDSQERTSDVISGTGLSFGVTTSVDTVKLFANGNVQANVYQNTANLNNASYGLNLGATSSGERLASTVRYSASQELGNYGTPGVAATTEKNLQNTQDAGLALRYRMAPRTNLVGGLGYQSVSYTASAFDGQENSSGVAFIDVTHRLNPEFTGGFGLRYSNGLTPRYAAGTTPGSFVSDRFEGEYIDFLGSWQPGSANTLKARISLTRTSHTQASQLDFTGLTGFISWTYVAGSRLSATASLAQNTGSGPALLGPLVAASPSTSSGGDGSGGSPKGGGSTGGGTGSGEGTGGSTGESPGSTPAGGAAGAPASTTVDNNRLNTSISLAASYRMSRTLTLDGNVSFNNAALVNSSNATGNAWSTAIGLGISYQPTRSIALGCSLNTTIQNASQSAEASGQAYSYRSPTVSCSGTFIFI